MMHTSARASPSSGERVMSPTVSCQTDVVLPDSAFTSHTSGAV
jgi:hypothetical protein